MQTTTSKTSKANGTTKTLKSKAAAVAGDGQVLAAAKRKPAPAAKPTKVAKAKATKPVSPTAVIRQLLATDPTMDEAALTAALAKKGLNPPRSTVSTVRADFLGCLRALQAAGRVKLH